MLSNLKIPPRPIFIRHEQGQIGILTVEKIIYGLHYQYKEFNNSFDKINVEIIEYDTDYETPIKEFILKCTEKDYKPAVAKELAKQRNKDIIKRLNEAIANKTSHGDLIKLQDPKDYPEFHEIDQILGSHKTSIRKVQTKESGTQKALKEIEDKEKEAKAKAKKQKELLKSLDKEVSEKYNGDYIDYAMDKSKFLILNESKNVTKQILMAFMVATKSKSLLNDIHGKADTGKSYIFEVAFDNYIPKEYVTKFNSSSLPGFINYCKDNPFYYDGQIIYLGDLGDKDTYERMKPIFNVLKIVISEKEFKDIKNEQQGKNWTPFDVIIKGVLGGFYCSVYEDNKDKTNQLDTRAISSTPSLNNPEDKAIFQQNCKIVGTVENAYYTKTKKELEGFQEHFKKSVRNYIKNQDVTMFINPFLILFTEITKHGITETRELDNMNEMFKAHCILNQNICFEFKKTINEKEINYIIPTIEQVQKFINITYTSLGLKQYERNLILKLKNELVSIDNETANNLYKSIEENEYEENYKNEFELVKESYKKLFIKNGINKETKKNKDENSQTKLNKNEYIRDKHFFRATDIKTRFKNHKSIKDIENLNNTLINLEHRGFLGKLEKMYNKANVYFLNCEIVEDISEDYNLNMQDILNAIKYLNTNFKENPYDSNSNSLFSTEEMAEIQKNYKLKNLKELKRYY